MFAERASRVQQTLFTKLSQAEKSIRLEHALQPNAVPMQGLDYQ